MFQTIKSQVPLLAVIQKDTNLLFKQSGENYVIEDEAEQGGCPLCGHKDCFKVKCIGEDDLNGFFKCFSCDNKGDVVTWRSVFKKIEAVDAARELASEYGVTLPRDYSPVQHAFQAAAHYYETCLLETCDLPYVELGRKTPLEYQKEVRKHSVEVLKQMHVGWSDGGLIEYLQSIGVEDEILVQTGLCSLDKTTKKIRGDFLPAKCFIYPHYVKGRVSHFTFKDPGKRLAYQLPKKYSLNGYTFYNQDSIKDADTVVVVEGENDLISVVDTGKTTAVIGTIGQLSSDQLDWMRENLSTKNVLTMFDPDDAGCKYRVKVEKNRKYFRNLAHVLPPEDKDIDELLGEGKDLEEIIRANTVKVDPNMFDKEADKGPALDVPWEQSTPEGFQTALTSSGLALPGAASEVSESSEGVSEDDLGEASCGDSKVLQKGSCYFRCKFKDGVPIYTKIANFSMKLLNVFLTEDGDRQREVVMIREGGYRSEPFMVNDETKVKVPQFKVLAARVADATFTGSENELAAIWEIVSSKSPAAEVKIPKIVGRHERHKAWIFRNKLISDTGDVIDPDENDIFWMRGRSVGLRPVSLSIEEGALSSDRSDIPALMTDLSVQEKDELIKGILENVGKNLNSLGKAVTMVAWTYSAVYSNFIFDMNRGFPFLFFWGVNGQGKSTVAKWITQDFFGINGHGSTSVPNLNTGVGWGRKSEYYASMPLFIDEVRSDEATKMKLGVFRSYYDREARTIAAGRDSFGVKNIRPRAVFVFNGEDQFDDPATRERCIPIRIPVKDRELQDSYKWMEERKHLFTGILFHWLLEFAEVMRDPEAQANLRNEIRTLDKELLKAGCSQRTSKNWAAVGVFGLRLAEKYLPGFDYKAYLIQASLAEANYQKSDTTLMQFWELVESTRAQEMSKITDKHIMAEGDMVHIWYPAVFRVISDEARGKFPFSKNAVLSALREEPYFISDDKKVSMGLDGTRRVVVTLDLTKAPDSIRNIALAN